MQKVKELIKQEKVYSIIIILIASIFICIPLMNKDIDMTYDDGVQHICRIIGTHQGIQEGNSTIFENFCNGFGYSWNLFYSPITAYFPLIFKLIGVSYAICIKLFMFTVVFLSGFFMYLFVKKIVKNNNIALIASIFYILAPYRFTDMYIRNALAELTSFTFLPLVFLGIYNLFEYDIKHNIKAIIPLVIGAVGIICSQTVIAMYTAFFVLIYIIINIVKILSKKNKDKFKKIRINKIFKNLLIATVLILIITSFLWMPLLEIKNSADYEVFKPGRMERTDVLVAYKLDFYRLFVTLGKDYMVYDIGLIVLIGLVLTPIAIKKVKKQRYYKLYLFSLISGIISCIITLKIFPFENLPSTLKMLQFSFRMLEFSSFFFAFVAGVNIYIVFRKLKIKAVFIILISMCVITLIFMSKARSLENYDEQRLINTVPVTEQTGRVHAGCASFEYLPSKAFENRWYIETRSQDAIILEGNASIENQEKNGSKMSFNIIKNRDSNDETNDKQENNISNEIKIELPYIYYPGYSVKVDYGEYVEEVNIYETDKGFVGITIPDFEANNLKVNVDYPGTYIMNITKIISTIGIVLFILYAIKNSSKENHKS